MNSDLKYKGERWVEVNLNSTGKHPKYEISDMGRVKSYALNKASGAILKGGNVNGYLSVMIRFDDGQTQWNYIHRLVAKYFVPNEDPSKKKYVIHNDFDKLNNSKHNLQWVSLQELHDHNNNNPNVIKRRVTGYKLTEADVRIIKKLLRNNKTRLSMIAKRFGITHTQLNRIRSGENWGHVEV
ncbi:MAG: NUMOD4 domain-containing protein [Bacteroidota bacterium]